MFSTRKLLLLSGTFSVLLGGLYIQLLNIFRYPQLHILFIITGLISISVANLKPENLVKKTLLSFSLSLLLLTHIIPLYDWAQTFPSPFFNLIYFVKYPSLLIIPFILSLHLLLIFIGGTLLFRILLQKK